MYLPLNNVFIWEISVCGQHAAFFEALGAILAPDDVIVFGCYDPGAEACDTMQQLSAEVTVPQKLYTDTVALNIEEHPRGRVFTIRARELGNTSVQKLMAVSEGQLLFFDNALGFRLGNPIVPLFNYHDANFADEAELSGHFLQDAVKNAFDSRGLKSESVLSGQVNPKWVQ